MSNLRKLSRWLLTSTLALALAACGGGGGGGGSGSGGGAAPAAVINGVAATGAAFTDAVVTVYDASGNAVGTSEPVAADGTYSVTLAANARAPFVVVATRTNASGAATSLVSLVPDALTRYVNITPITNLVAARHSPTGNPAALPVQVQSGQATITPATVALRVQEILAILKPVLDALGVTDTDPMSGRFTVDGTGYDRFLDSVAVNIIPAGATSNIEIAVRARPATDTEQPPVVQFVSNQAVLPVLPPITAAALVPSGTSAQITSLLARITACYAVPYASRVNNATGTATTGGAADVIAPACRSMFVGNDPANYKSNGFLVGRSASNTGAFAGLFRAGATGVVFDQGTFEFSRVNGDVVLGWRARDTAGGETFDAVVARLDGGVLKLIGNQYAYNGRIAPFHQERKFATLNQSAYDYFSSGYTMHVDQIGNQFAKVEVVTPRGNVITLVPGAGIDFLQIQGLSATNVLRLRTEFINASDTRDPRSVLTSEVNSLAFANPTFTNAQLAELPAQGVWTYRYFLAGNATTTPDAIQGYRTRARALSIPEFRNRPFAALTADTLTQLQASANAFGQVPLPNNAGAMPSWTVPVGALPPISVSLFGRAPVVGGLPGARFSFNDSASFASSARTATIRCLAQGVGDTHCDGATNFGFTAGATATLISLFSRDAAGREYAGATALYQLTVAP